jgi:hypothetical protein
MRLVVVVHGTLLVLATALSAGCHHPAAQTAVTPRASLEEGHCWWAAYRSAMPPDSVAAHYAQAYTTLGLAGAGWSQQGDTAWAQAEPTRLSRPAGTGTFAARVVAYRRGDSTFLRPFVAVRTEGDGNGGAMSIEFCGDVSRASHVAAAGPRDEEPDDSLPLWRRRPIHQEATRRAAH